MGTSQTTDNNIQDIKKENNTKVNSTTNTEVINKNAPSTYPTQTSNISTINNSSSTTSLPQTGNNSVFMISIVFGVITLAIISKIKLNKLKDI